MLLPIFALFLGTDILVKGRLALLSSTESGQFTITDNKQEASTSMIFISLKRNNISFGVGFAYYVIKAVQSQVE